MYLRLKEARLDQNLTQKELAALLNVTQQTYSDYETGRTNPDLLTLTKIADFLKVSTDYLLGRADDFGVISIANVAQELTEEERELLATFRKLDMLNRLHVSTYATVRLENQTGGAGGRRA